MNSHTTQEVMSMITYGGTITMRSIFRGEVLGMKRIKGIENDDQTSSEA
jgi:hypothetical protein